MTWCFLPDTASPSVQAAADLTWVLTLPSRALPPPASSSGRNTPDPSSSPHSAPDTSPRPRSGTTSRHSTEGHGAASVIPCLPDTHASRFPQRDKERARTIHGTSGLTLPGSSERFNRNGSSLRTSPATSALALKPCCEPYGTWASRLRLAYSLRQKSARRTKGSGSSSWPTATAHSFAQTAEDPTPGQTGGTTLAGAAELQAMWFTPNTPNGGRTLQEGTSPTGITPDGVKRQVGLENQTRLWATPTLVSTREGWTAGDLETRREEVRRETLAKGKHHTGNGFGLSLGAQAGIWPTPTAQNVKGSSEGSITRADGKSRMDILHYRAEQGFSRPAHLTAPPGPKLSQLRPIWRPLRASLIASHGRAVWRRLWTSREKARLNPAFVAWLMGWPPGHALCASSAMEWSLWQRDMRGALSALPTASGAWIWKPSIERMKPVQRDLFAEMDA